MEKNLLITGGVGFIGLNATEEFLLDTSFQKIVIIDALKYDQKIEKIAIFLDPRIHFIKGDINDRELIDKTLIKYKITHIVHLAAESHVDNSIANPNQFIYSNINGTFNLLEAFKNYWNLCGNQKHWRFLFLSTDEVFGSLNTFDKPFDELSIHNPSSPYSASKSSAEQLTRAWFKTYNLPVVIINCTNNYGPYQYKDKLIPVIIKSILRGKKIPVYGDGTNIRDWIHVKDHCRAIKILLEKGRIGDSYCVGANAEISNINLINIICKEMDQLQIGFNKNDSYSLIEFTKDRLGHDFRYAINTNKINKEIGWNPRYQLRDGIKDVIKWYLDNKGWLEI